MNKQQVIEKVQKILRKADLKKNSSIKEAESALNLAHKLLKKYHLSMSQVVSFDSSLSDDHSSIDLTSKVGVTFKASAIPKWMSILITVINTITETKNLIRYKNIKEKTKHSDLDIVFIGDETDVILAIELFNFLRNTITKLSSKHIRENKLSFRQWRSFAEGCSCKLLQRVLKTENINEKDKCCIDNFEINLDDIDETLEEDDNDLDNDTELEDLEDREIDEDKDVEEKYEIFLLSKKEKIDDYIKNLEFEIKKDEISFSKKLDLNSFDSGQKEGESIPLKIYNQIKKSKNKI